MQNGCGRKTWSQRVVGATKMNRITRTFGAIAHASANVPRSVVASADSERIEVAQAFQLEAEQKRALGISYYRRDTGR